MDNSPDMFLLGPLDEGRYGLVAAEFSEEFASKLTGVGYSAVESSIGYSIEPGFVRSPEEHATFLSRALGITVTPLSPLKD